MCAIMFVVFTYACTYAQMHTAEFCVCEKSNVNDTVVMCALKLSCIDGVPRSRLSIYHACTSTSSHRIAFSHPPFLTETGCMACDIPPL